MKLNNKGQTLILFVLLLPLMIMMLALVVDLGLLMTKTYKVKSTIVETIEYGLENTNEDTTEQMKNMLRLNLDKDTTYDVSEGTYIIIKVRGTYNSVFTTVFKKESYAYNYTYKGYKENNKTVIEKEG